MKRDGMQPEKRHIIKISLLIYVTEWETTWNCINWKSQNTSLRREISIISVKWTNWKYSPKKSDHNNILPLKIIYQFIGTAGFWFRKIERYHVLVRVLNDILFDVDVCFFHLLLWLIRGIFMQIVAIRAMNVSLNHANNWRCCFEVACKCNSRWEEKKNAHTRSQATV